jgi:protein-disulfide isomerase
MTPEGSWQLATGSGKSMTRSPSPAVFATGIHALLVAMGVASCGGSSSDTPTTPTPTAQLPAMSLMLSEKTLGSPTAPVTMVEYSSLGCFHCADFHATTLPALKSAYIDTGRVRLVYRDYPLDEAASLAGSMVARCSGDAYFATLDALFKAQASWAYASNYTSGIKNVVAGLGMTSDVVDTCLASTELRNGVLAIRQAGSQTYGVSGTPTFVLVDANGKIEWRQTGYSTGAGLSIPGWSWAR